MKHTVGGIQMGVKFTLGADRIAWSLELWDENKAKSVTPGKIGITTHLDRTCVKIFRYNSHRRATGIIRWNAYKDICQFRSRKSYSLTLKRLTRQFTCVSLFICIWLSIATACYHAPGIVIIQDGKANIVFPIKLNDRKTSFVLKNGDKTAVRVPGIVIVSSSGAARFKKPWINPACRPRWSPSDRRHTRPSDSCRPCRRYCQQAPSCRIARPIRCTFDSMPRKPRDRLLMSGW